jgi:hypothetical protein
LPWPSSQALYAYSAFPFISEILKHPITGFVNPSPILSPLMLKEHPPVTPVALPSLLAAHSSQV